MAHSGEVEWSGKVRQGRYYGDKPLPENIPEWRKKLAFVIVSNGHWIVDKSAGGTDAPPYNIPKPFNGENLREALNLNVIKTSPTQESADAMIMYLADKHYDVCTDNADNRKNVENEAYGCKDRVPFTVSQLDKAKILCVSTKDMYLVGHLLDQLLKRYDSGDARNIPLLIIFLHEKNINDSHPSRVNLDDAKFKRAFKEKYTKLKQKVDDKFCPVLFLQRTSENVTNIMQYSDREVKNMSTFVPQNIGDNIPVYTKVNPPEEDGDPCTKVVLLDADEKNGVDAFEEAMYGPNFRVAVGGARTRRGPATTQSYSEP